MTTVYQDCFSNRSNSFYLSFPHHITFNPEEEETNGDPKFLEEETNGVQKFIEEEKKTKNNENTQKFNRYSVESFHTCYDEKIDSLQMDSSIERKKKKSTCPEKCLNCKIF